MTPIGKTSIVQAAIAATTAPKSTDARDAELRAVAQKLEASFLSEMLKYAGVGETKSAFGGGLGEEQFASFLRQAHADEIAKTGGIGLAERLFQSLKEASREDL